jgi:hypothetical protein
MKAVAWKVFTDTEGTSYIVIDNGAEGGIPSKEQCERAVRLLNEEGSSVIRLGCHNKLCEDFGGWIERPRNDVARTVYRCELCGGVMER